jgi:hypothetical protein
VRPSTSALRPSLVGSLRGERDLPRLPGPHFGVMLVRDLPQRLLSLADDVRCVSEYLSVRLRHLHPWYLLHFVAYP